MDLSESCGYPVEAQIALFKSLKPLFNEKPTFIVINKIDVRKPEDLSPELAAELDALIKAGDYEVLKISCNTQEGVQEVKNKACERLIAERVAKKLKEGTKSDGTPRDKLANIMQRIHVAQPIGGGVQETFTPDIVKSQKAYDKNDPDRRKLARDIQDENGGAGVYNVDLRMEWKLKNPEWTHDKIPEVGPLLLSVTMVRRVLTWPDRPGLRWKECL